MIKQAAVIDPMLEPLLRRTREDEAAGFVTQLVTAHAEPVIKGVIRCKLHLPSDLATGQADADDLCQEAIVQLLERLSQFRRQPDAHPIHDLRGLAAVIAHRTCSHWMRRRFPARHAFKNRLRYLLSRQRGLSLWQDESKKLTAGFAAWQGQRATVSGKRLEQLMDDEVLAVQIRLFATGGQQARPAAALAAIFNRLGGPIGFEDLVKALAAALPVKDQQAESTDCAEYDTGLAGAGEADTAWRVEKRIFLQRVWEEICQLPTLQRAALLLNLKEPKGGGCLAIFQATGIATFRQLAETLEMSAEALAVLWNELPIPDARIADLMQLTRQQVINARKSARERLTRRLRGFL